MRAKSLAQIVDTGGGKLLLSHSRSAPEKLGVDLVQRGCYVRLNGNVFMIVSAYGATVVFNGKTPTIDFTTTTIIVTTA